jgi:hypothetical protein
MWRRISAQLPLNFVENLANALTWDAQQLIGESRLMNQFEGHVMSFKGRGDLHRMVER